jgi:hypothetical protein
MLDLGRFAELGRNGDDTIGHLTTGERIIPKGVLGQDLTNKIIQAMQTSGLNPSQYVVGNKSNSFNPATGQPEFAITTGGNFGFQNVDAPRVKPGKPARFASGLYDVNRAQAADIANLTQQIVPVNTVGGTTLEGNAQLSPEMMQLMQQNMGQAGLWNNQVGQQLGQSQDRSNRLEDAYSSFGDSQFNTRQDLENLFMDQAGMQQNQNNMFNNSALASLIGGSGGGSSTYAGAGALQGANNLANQQLRIGAYQGAQTAFNSEIENLQRMLMGSSGLETEGMARAIQAQNGFNSNFGNMNDLQNSQLNQMIVGRGLGDDATNFSMNRLAGSIGAMNPSLELGAKVASMPGKKKFGWGNVLSAVGAGAQGFATGGWKGAATGAGASLAGDLGATMQ